MRVPSPARRSGSRTLPSRNDVLLGIAFVAWTVAAVVLYAAVDSESRPLDAVGVVLVVLIAGPVAVRRWPLFALAVCVTALVPFHLRGYARLEVVLPAVLVLLYTVAVTGSRIRAAVTGAVVAGAMLISMRFSVGSWPGGDAVETVGWMLAALALGQAIHSHQAYAAAVEDRAARAEHTREQEARRRVAEERLRIARDLHDMMAHHITAINMQSSVAAHLIDQRDDVPQLAELSASLHRVTDASGSALAEVRALLGMLRGFTLADDEREGEPTPGLDRLADLLASAQAGGVQVNVQQDGERRTLPPPVDVAAYRIIQEALTNVGRHAPGAQSTVEITYRTGELSLRIVDDGTTPTDPDAAPGYGLTGMRERANAVGGSVSIGPLPGGGFAVEAVLPTRSRPPETVAAERASE